jgi:hypothetical protein
MDRKVYVSLDCKPKGHPGTNTAVLNERIWSSGLERSFHGTFEMCYMATVVVVLVSILRSASQIRLQKRDIRGSTASSKSQASPCSFKSQLRGWCQTRADTRERTHRSTVPLRPGKLQSIIVVPSEQADDSTQLLLYLVAI